MARLERLGAKAIEEHGLPGLSWAMLVDPGGNEFCVAEDCVAEDCVAED